MHWICSIHAFSSAFTAPPILMLSVMVHASNLTRSTQFLCEIGSDPAINVELMMDETD